MNNLIIIFCFFLFHNNCFSQSEHDYTSKLELIRKEFNQKNQSLIYKEFTNELKDKIKEIDLKTVNNNLYEKNGKMLSYELLMEDEKGKNYLVEFENNSMLLIINLTKDLKVSSFKIQEY